MTSIIFVTIVLTITASLLYYASWSRRRAVQAARAEVEQSCAQSGLQIAYAYFTDPQQVMNWNTYLNDPSEYNPVPSTWNTTPALANGWSALILAKPQLFYDLDGDGKEDVYIYIRDNADDMGVQLWNVDADQTVYLGAVCISSTLLPRNTNGVSYQVTRNSSGVATATNQALVVEALVSLKNNQCPYGAQHGSCLGNGNLNTFSGT